MPFTSNKQLQFSSVENRYFVKSSKETVAAGDRGDEGVKAGDSGMDNVIDPITISSLSSKRFLIGLLLEAVAAVELAGTCAGIDGVSPSKDNNVCVLVGDGGSFGDCGGFSERLSNEATTTDALAPTVLL